MAQHIPYVAPEARCLAPDLIGMGASGKAPDGNYSFGDHARYLDAWFDAVIPEGQVALVVHDWGGALGFDWARRNPDRVRAIAYMETIVCTVNWDDWPDSARGIFQGMRSPKGEELVLERNLFIEGILPNAILRELTPEEHDVYRAPWRHPGESRRPMLTWPREIPIEGEPEDMARIVDAYAELAQGQPDPQAVRQRRAGLDPDRPPPRVLPHLGQPGGGHGRRRPLHPGGFARRDRRRRRPVPRRESLTPLPFTHPHRKR